MAKHRLEGNGDRQGAPRRTGRTVAMAVGLGVALAACAGPVGDQSPAQTPTAAASPEQVPAPAAVAQPNEEEQRIALEEYEVLAHQVAGALACTLANENAGGVSETEWGADSFNNIAYARGVDGELATADDRLPVTIDADRLPGTGQGGVDAYYAIAAFRGQPHTGPNEGEGGETIRHLSVQFAQKDADPVAAAKVLDRDAVATGVGMDTSFPIELAVQPGDASTGLILQIQPRGLVASPRGAASADPGDWTLAHPDQVRAVAAEVDPLADTIIHESGLSGNDCVFDTEERPAA